jgi:hypothetical protein
VDGRGRIQTIKTVRKNDIRLVDCGAEKKEIVRIFEG